MRLYLVFVLISLISLSNGQQGVPESSFTTLSSSPSNFGTFSRFNPINRLLGWFRRPKNTAAVNRLNSLDNDSDKEEFNFNNPFAKESTSDKIIEDAISKNILEEGKKQQVAAGSNPFIVVVDDEDQINSSSERNLQVLDSKLTLENQKLDGKFRVGKSIADEQTDKIPLEEALRIVSTSSLTDCVARVVCELSCNANSYGTSGRAVFRNLIKLQFDQTLKGDDIKYFRQAASKGRQLVQAKKDCSDCYTIYPSCKSSSNDLVAVSSMFKL